MISSCHGGTSSTAGGCSLGWEVERFFFGISMAAGSSCEGGGCEGGEEEEEGGGGCEGGGGGGEASYDPEDTRDCWVLSVAVVLVGIGGGGFPPL